MKLQQKEYPVHPESEDYSKTDRKKYDMKYIVNRMLRLGINPHEMCRVKSYIKFKYIPYKDYNECVMKGRVVFDLSYAYMRIHEGEVRFKSLDFIAKEERPRRQPPLFKWNWTLKAFVITLITFLFISIWLLEALETPFEYGDVFSCFKLLGST